MLTVAIASSISRTKLQVHHLGYKTGRPQSTSRGTATRPARPPAPARRCCRSPVPGMTLVRNVCPLAVSSVAWPRSRKGCRRRHGRPSRSADAAAAFAKQVDHRHVVEIEPVAVEIEGRPRPLVNAEHVDQEVAHRLLVEGLDGDVVKPRQGSLHRLRSRATPRRRPAPARGHGGCSFAARSRR